jgi:hypothetical protein
VSAPFDTHAVVQQLEQLGFPTPQAEGLTAILTQVVASQEFATKADIAAVRADIAALRLSTKADIETLRLSTKADIETLRLSTKADLNEARLGVEVKLATLQGEIQSDIRPLKWGMALVVGGVISLVVKAFLHL